MKITRSQIRRLISEELSIAIRESDADGDGRSDKQELEDIAAVMDDDTVSTPEVDRVAQELASKWGKSYALEGPGGFRRALIGFLERSKKFGPEEARWRTKLSNARGDFVFLEFDKLPSESHEALAQKILEKLPASLA